MKDKLKFLQPFKNESGIVNLDSSEGPGTHWVAYRKRGNVIYYFDSYGNLKPPLELVTYLIKNTNNAKIFYNVERHQNKTYNCGHLTLEFLYNS